MKHGNWSIHVHTSFCKISSTLGEAGEVESPDLNNDIFLCLFNLRAGPLKACIFAHSTIKLALHLTLSYLCLRFTERQYYIYSKTDLLLRR